MTKMEEEKLQRDELLVDDKNLFVIAGAGAGKTYSLVHRIVNSLERGVKTSEVVAISFTNKSAEELRERIIKELSDNNSPHLNTIDEMTISTIHKFCINILRENSIYANLSPDFSLIDDDSERIGYVIRKYLRGFKDFRSFSPFGKKLYTIAEDIKAFYNTLVNYVDKVDFNNVVRNEYDTDKCINDIKENLEDILDIIYHNKDYLLEISNTDEMDNLFTKPCKIFNEEGITVDKLFSDLKMTKDTNIFSGNALRSKAAKEAYGPIKEEIDSLRDLYLDNKAKLNICYQNKVFKYAYEAYTKYLEYIENDHNNITNNQAIYLAMKLLDNQAICVKLHNKYKHIYIDEYQDTDHMQYNIASKLTKLNGKFPNESALFLVGDPKQSIYRFRGAEPELYKATMEEYRRDQDNCKIYELDINFRSNSKILEYVNYVYTKEGIKLTDPNKNEYSEMLCAPKNIIKDSDINDDNIIGFYNYVYNDKYDDLIKLIKYLKFNKKVRVVNKDDTYYYRNIEYRDIMIMMKDHNKMPEYVSILNKNNIPTKVSGESKFGVLFSIRCYVSLFEALNTRGPKSRQKAYEVFKNVFNGEFVNLNKDEEKKLLEKYYNKLTNETHGKTSYGIAIYLIKHLNWIIKENDVIADYELNSLSSKLYQMVEKVFSSDYLNGNDLSKEFRSFIDNDSYVEYESLTDKDSDTVSVINVHKSKGLEAPICIWVCEDTLKTNNKWYRDDKLYFKDLIYDEELLGGLSTDDELELNRLEYVAATRAKEAFIFFNDGNIKGMFNNPNYEIETLPTIKVEKDEKDDPSERDAEVFSIKDNSYVVDTNILKVISPSSMENNISLTREKLKVGKDISSNRPVGNILGTILHRALELMVLDKDIDNSVKKALEENIDDINGDYDSYYKFIRSCVIETNKYYKENGYYNYELYPELTFSYLKDKNVISNGSIDLLVKDNNRIKIIDYKSDCAEYIEDDNVFEFTLKEKYEPQLDLYEETVKELFKDKDITIEKSIIYYRNYNKDSGDIRIKEYKL